MTMSKEGGMNKRTWLVLIIIIAGVSYHVYQLYQIQQQLRLESTVIENVAFEGTLDPLPLPSDITFDLVLTVNNPTKYALDVERVTYIVDVNGERYLSGSLQELKIAGTTPIRVPLKISLEQAAATAIDALLAEGMEIRVSGTVEVPLKLFGVHKLLSISVPYEKTEHIPVTVLSDVENYIDELIAQI